MTKPQERSHARQMRQSGMSIKDIAQQLGVTKSSVSVWVRDIELSPDQIVALHDKYHHYEAKTRGSRANYEKGLQQRRAYQQEGRARAAEGDPLHLAGCMLYWAEGTKARTSLKLVNSDPDMIRFFAKFLRESLHVPDEKMNIHIVCYTHNDISAETIEDFWLTLLVLPRSCLKKTLANTPPSSSNQRGRKLRYGVCTLSVYNTRLVQHIFGAIQEYIGIDKPAWLT